MQNADIVQKLLAEVEHKFGIGLQKPSDFERLKNLLPADTPLSVSTLKRVWNYVPNEHTPRLSTLDTLSRFCGFSDWAGFCRHHLSDSDFFFETIKPENLPDDCLLELEWNPNRKIVVKKLRGGKLRVEEAVQCKLCVGDVFSTAWISVGQPLYATQLQRNGLRLPDYVAGRTDGLSSVKQHLPNQTPNTPCEDKTIPQKL